MVLDWITTMHHRTISAVDTNVCNRTPCAVVRGMSCTPLLENTQQTNAEQSKLDGGVPPKVYGIPRYLFASVISTCTVASS